MTLSLSEEGTQQPDLVKKLDKNPLRLRYVAFVIRLLRAVESGDYPSKIARYMGVKRQVVDYYLRKLRKAGYLRKIKRGMITNYELTPLCQAFLTRSEKPPVSGVCRLHHYGLQFPVKSGPGFAVDWRKVAGIQNWDKFVGTEMGLTVEFVDASERKLIVWAEPISGSDSMDLLLRANLAIMKVAQFVASKYEMRLGEPSVVSKPHFAIASPEAEEITKHIEVTTQDGKMDRSEGYGEKDIFTPELANATIALPLTIERMERTIEALSQSGVKMEQRMAKVEDAIIVIAAFFKSQTKDEQPKGEPSYRG